MRLALIAGLLTGVVMCGQAKAQTAYVTFEIGPKKTRYDWPATLTLSGTQISGSFSNPGCSSGVIDSSQSTLIKGHVHIVVDFNGGRTCMFQSGSFDGWMHFYQQKGGGRYTSELPSQIFHIE